MALINPPSSVGVNGQVAPSSSNVEGFNNNQAGTQQVSQSTPLPTQDQAVAAAQTTDGSLSVFISGDPNGDFAGVNILEQVVTDGTGLAINTRTQNPVKTDINNATILSDAPQAVTVTARIGDFTLIDTTGYQSLQITTNATFVGLITGTNDGVTFSSVQGYNLASIASAASISGSGNYLFPCSARYIRISCSTVGSFTYYLRNQPITNNFVNLTQIGGSSVQTGGLVGTLAVGSAAAVGAVPTSNPLLAGGVDSGGLTRRLSTDTTGVLNVTLPTNQLLNVSNQYSSSTIYPEQYKPLRVEQIHSDRGQDSLQDLLQQILVELKTLNYYTREIPNSINLMLQQSSIYSATLGSMADEQEQFFSDTTLFNLTKGQ